MTDAAELVKLADELEKMDALKANAGFAFMAAANAPQIIAALRLATQQDGAWQPIETAPKDGTAILLYEPDWPSPWQRVWCARWVEAKKRFESSQFKHSNATHWRSLDDLPQRL